MELLNEIKFFNRTNKIPTQCLKEAFLNTMLFEDGDPIDTPERVDVLNHINNDDYIRNNYASFANDIEHSKYSEFLTHYTVDEMEKLNIQTFQVPGYEIGFALKKLPQGVDIVGVHNNTDIKNVGEALIDSAIRLGGTHLDHFDGFLSDFYSKKGFDEYERFDWDERYAPKNWDRERFGTPQVIMRRHRSFKP